MKLTCKARVIGAYQMVECEKVAEHGVLLGGLIYPFCQDCLKRYDYNKLHVFKLEEVCDA